MMSLLTLKKLTKDYGAGFKLGPIDFTLPPGQTVALLGPNGAGKSTLFQLITGSLDATDGEVWFLDKRLVPESFELKRMMGYLPQSMTLPRWVTGRELLTYAAKLHRIADPKKVIGQAMEFWDCGSYVHKPLAACSYGMLKRVGLALVNLHNPQFLILDEPFSGLDLFHIRALEECILQRQKAAQATIISTHEAHNAAKLAQHAVILQAGQLSDLHGWQAADVLNRIDLIEKTFFSVKN